MPVREDSEQNSLSGLTGLGVGVLTRAGLVSAISGRSQSRLRDRFESLSSEPLDRSNHRFLALTGERHGAATPSNEQALERREAAVDALVRPLRESLTRVDEKLQRVETAREGHYRALTNHLELVTRTTVPATTPRTTPQTEPPAAGVA